MSKDPERIWLEPTWPTRPSMEREWCEDQIWPDATEYVRADLLAAAIRALPVPEGEVAEEASTEVDPSAFERWWKTRYPDDLRAVAIKADLVFVSGGMLFLTPSGRKLRKRGEALRAARGQP